MRNLFCPKCGKTANKLHAGLCEECFLEKFDFASKLPNKLIIPECRECGRFYISGKGFFKLDDAIGYFLKGIKDKEIYSVTYRISNDKLYVTIYSKLGELNKREEKIMEFKQPKVVCKICNMKFSGYFNAILQVRGNFNRDKILKEIESNVEKLNKEDKMAFVSRTSRKKEGLDLQFGSKSTANKIARALKARYNAKIKLSSTLYGMKEGKKIYRDTILVLFGE